MEDIIVQSAMAEIAMWDAFHTGRGANAIWVTCFNHNWFLGCSQI